MSTGAKRPKEPSNYLSEWYGFRVYPDVDASTSARHAQHLHLCPFITAATGSQSECAKQGQTGVCSIRSRSNGVPQEWLACPFRLLDTRFAVLEAATRRLFELEAGEPIALRPISALRSESVYPEVSRAVEHGTPRLFLFTQTGLGGEVKVPETAGSPGLEVDVTVVEVVRERDGAVRLGKFAFLEMQTMDFHGSPLHATARLDAARRADPSGYHALIASHPEWMGEKVEGPNKANVFKRTLYQTVMKIQLTRDRRCAGFAIVLPEPVWDSWRVHLGLPALRAEGDHYRLAAPSEESGLVEPDRAWIYVVDVDLSSRSSPRPLKIVKTIATTSAALIHYAFEAASAKAVENGAMDAFAEALATRVRAAWPSSRRLWDESGLIRPRGYRVAKRAPKA